MLPDRPGQERLVRLSHRETPAVPEGLGSPFAPCGPGIPCSPLAPCGPGGPSSLPQLKQFAHSLLPNPIEAPAEDFQGIADLLFVRAVDSSFFRGIRPPGSLLMFAAYVARPAL
jgi:hypothetical protein